MVLPSPVVHSGRKCPDTGDTLVVGQPITSGVEPPTVGLHRKSITDLPGEDE